MTKTKSTSKKEAKPKKTASKKTAEPKKKATKKQSNVTAEAVKKLNETEVVVVLDRSGSMQSIVNSTVDGYNKFINEQKNADGTAFITLVQFDHLYEIIYKSKPVSEVIDLIAGETYMPRGLTALHDAIGKTINDLNTDRDVVFVIITDGDENSSKEYKGEAIKKMIQTMENDKQWKFVYMGANQDAVTIGQNFGIKGSNAVTYTADNQHVNVAFSNVSGNVRKMRSAKKSYYETMQADDSVTYDAVVTMSLMENDLSFTSEQRDKSVK